MNCAIYLLGSPKPAIWSTTSPLSLLMRYLPLLLAIRFVFTFDQWEGIFQEWIALIGRFTKFWSLFCWLARVLLVVGFCQIFHFFLAFLVVSSINLDKFSEKSSKNGKSSRFQDFLSSFSGKCLLLCIGLGCLLLKS